MGHRRTLSEKREFIKRLAEGESIRKISEDMKISRGTLQLWQKKFASEIEAAKRADLVNMIEEYGLAKEVRVKRLLATLNKISNTLSRMDFSRVSPDKLASLQLQYLQAIKVEIADINPVTIKNGAITPEIINNAYADLLQRTRAGDITKDQATSESAILINMMKVYEAAEIRVKVEELEQIVDDLQNRAAKDAGNIEGHKQ